MNKRNNKPDNEVKLKQVRRERNILSIGDDIAEYYTVKDVIFGENSHVSYRVHDKKTLSEKLLIKLPGFISNDKEAASILQKTVRNSRKVVHRNVARIYDIQLHGFIKFIETEFIQGIPLCDAKLEFAGDKFSEEKVIAYALQIAEGMAHVHDKGVLHKDLRPHVIMIDHNDNIKITGTAISEALRSIIQKSGREFSTSYLPYASPEHIDGSYSGNETDIYSFGVLLYELLSGHPPFYKGDIKYQIVNSLPTPLSGCSNHLTDIVMKCLDKNHARRYPTFTEVIEALKNKNIKLSSSAPSQKSSPVNSFGVIKKLTPVSLETEPPDTLIRVDDKAEKPAPFRGKLSVGMHKFSISREGYKTIETQFMIPDSHDNDFFVELECLMGAIIVHTDQPDCDFKINGEIYPHKTPATIENVIPGKLYTIQIVKEGFYSQPLEITIDDRERKTVKPELQRVAPVLIETQPPSSELVIDDTKVVAAPFSGKLTVGMHKLQVRKKYYHNLEVEICVHISAENKFSYELESLKGTLRVKAGGERCNILLNGENTGKKTPYTILNVLPHKQYEIILDSDKYYSEPVNVSVKEKEYKNIEIPLLSYSPSPEMVFVKGGKYLRRLELRNGNIIDVKTTIDNFFIAKYPVTQREWSEIMGGIDPGHHEKKLPVGNVTWYDVLEFCNKLSAREGLKPVYLIDKQKKDINNNNPYDDHKWTVKVRWKANGYRLPTDAEWEYAAIGGSISQQEEVTDPADNIDMVAWHKENSGGKAQPVGLKQPNEIGIFDMNGNVYEWCWDWFGPYDKKSKKNPTGPISGSERIRRGGSWKEHPYECGIENRKSSNPSFCYLDFGFRLCRTTR